MSKAKKKPIFTRGYDECREGITRSARFTRSCFNCVYFFRDFGDEEEVCQNAEVTQYDMVVDGNNIYCTYWKQSSIPAKEQSMFKRGRSRLD